MVSKPVENEGALVHPETNIADGLERLAEERWSCRAFLSKPVERPLIERILRCAQHAPSWCNTQPWQLVIASGEETERFRQGLLAAVDEGRDAGHDMPPPKYEGIYLERRREVGWQLYEAVGIARGDRAASTRQARENFRLFDAPHVAIVTSARSLGPYGVLDCGAFINMFLLAARSVGVATIAQAAIASHSPFVRRFFGLGEDRLLLCAISFGYADESHPANSYRTRRASLSDVVSWRDG